MDPMDLVMDKSSITRVYKQMSETVHALKEYAKEQESL